jgi:hypothetical protein
VERHGGRIWVDSQAGTGPADSLVQDWLRPGSSEADICCTADRGPGRRSHRTPGWRQAPRVAKAVADGVAEAYDDSCRSGPRWLTVRRRRTAPHRFEVTVLAARRTTSTGHVAGLLVRPLGPAHPVAPAFRTRTPRHTPAIAHACAGSPRHSGMSAAPWKAAVCNERTAEPF